MIRTAPYRCFYVIVHACCFSPEKFLTNALQFAFNCIDISHPLRCFTILSAMTNIDFLFFSPFVCHFLWSCAVIFFCGLQPLTIQWSYDCHVLVDLLRYISLLFFYLAFFFFIAESSWSVCILACSRWFLCFIVVYN